MNFTLISTATDVAVVSGVVSDAQTGAPLGGALVTVTVNGIAFVVPTGPDGSYTLLVEPGPVEVEIAREGFVNHVDSGMPGAGETLVVDASLISWSVVGEGAEGDPSGDPASSVAGTVTDESTDLPLDGALVLVVQGETSLSATTGATGSYAVPGVPVGDFEVTILRVGYFPAIFEITTTTPHVVSLDVALEPIPATVTLVGTVTSGLTGLPEAGVEIKVLGAPIVAETDANGEYVLPDVPLGEQTLRLRKGGFEDRFFTFDDLQPLPGAGPIESNFDYPTATEGTFVLAIDPDAQGSVSDLFSAVLLAGAEIEAEGTVVTADVLGHFEFSGLTPFETIDITATAPGHLPETRRALVVPGGEDELDFELRPTTRGSVTGTVTDSVSGDPIALASAGVTGAEKLVVGTEPDGTYGLVGVPDGTYTFTFSHPEYLSTAVPGVAVVDATVTAAVDAMLTPRPTTGTLTGTITDSATGLPVTGAQVGPAGGSTVVTDNDGAYTLGSLSSGLVTLTIEAAGFPTTTRTTAVVADIDPSTPTATTADFQLSQDPAEPSEVTVLVDAGEGGALEMLDGRLRVDILPLSLTGDALVTLRLEESPQTTSGAPFAVAFELGVSNLVALGAEVKIVVDAPVVGDPVPTLRGPAILTFRYSETQAEFADVAEPSLSPYYFDGTEWTALRFVPFMHAADPVNNRVVTAIDFSTTETGNPVLAGLTLERPILVAQQGGGGSGGNPVREFILRLAGKIEGFFEPPPAAELVDILGERPDDIHPNAFPLLVFHGWDPTNLVLDSELNEEPLMGEGRFAQVIPDLLDATNKVYRPVFVAYNTRADLWETGKGIERMLSDDLGRGEISGLPIPGVEGSGQFTSVNAFGFSMGGLAARVNACLSGRTTNMITMGTPHHGAMFLLTDLLSVDLRSKLALEILKQFSPGTAQLFDYSDGAALAVTSGNPFLYRLNRGRCGRPRRGMALISGDDSIPLTGGLGSLLDAWIDEAVAAGVLPESAQSDPETINRLLSVGNLLNAEPSDGVVPVTSAQAKTRSGRRVPGIGGVSRLEEPEPKDFNHLNVGTPAFPISEFVQADIVPALSDWVVEDGDFRSEVPTTTEPGWFEGEFTIDFNLWHNGITGVLPVVYGKDANDEWHVLSGADPDSLEPDTSRVVTLCGNSALQTSRCSENQGAEMLDLNRETVPVVDPSDPSTDIQTVQLLIIRLGANTQTVPSEPTGSFLIPSPPAP